MIGCAVGQAVFDAANPLLLIDQTQDTAIGIVELGHVRGVFIDGDVGLPPVPVTAPAQLIAVDLDGLGVEALDVEGAAHVTQEALDVRQRKALAEIGEDVLMLTQVIDRAQVIERGVVFEGVTGQDGAYAGLHDLPVGDAVGDLAFDPFAAHTATQGPVTDVPGHLPEQRLGGGFDIRAHLVSGAGLGVGQPFEGVLVTALAGAFVIIVGAPDQVACGAANGRQRRVDGRTQAVDILHAVVVGDPGLAPRQVREEQRVGPAPVTFQLQALAVEVVVGVVEVGRLVMGIGLVIKFQPLDRHGLLRVFRVFGVAGVLLVLVVLQRQAEFFVGIQFVTETTLQVIGFGVHVAALGGVLRDAIAVAVILVVALGQVGGHVPVQGILAPGRTLKGLVGETLAVEVVAGGQAQFAAVGKVLTLVALGDDVDDAARSTGAIDAAGTGNHLDAFDTGRRDAVELAEVVTRGVLRHAVDQHQHVAPAQGLAEVAHPAAGRRQAGNQLPQNVGDPTPGATLLADLLLVDHLDRARNRGNARFAASRGNDGGLHVQCAGLLVAVLGPGLDADGAEQRNQQGKFGSGHEVVFF
ncbi:hypothetical protein D3C76_708560 [compost metagenome]